MQNLSINKLIAVTPPVHARKKLVQERHFAGTYLSARAIALNYLVIARAILD